MTMMVVIMMMAAMLVGDDCGGSGDDYSCGRGGLLYILVRFTHLWLLLCILIIQLTRGL